MGKIRVEHLTVAFRKRLPSGQVSRLEALKDLSLEVLPQEICVIVGPSGGGKTTLLRAIHGLQRPTAGAVYVGGTRVTGPGQDRGFVFQNFALLAWRTVRQNVEFGLEVRGVPPAERRAIGDRYIRLVGLVGFEGHYPHELSGGMQQRAGLARALAINPATLLMDEPFASLDAQTRETLQGELLKIQDQEKKTVVFVTHSIDEAIYLGDRIVVFSPRPARVREIVEVRLPERRWENPEEVKSLPAFVNLRLHLAKLLKSEGQP